MKILVIVDMQNDFINGSLGSPEAQAIVPYVCGKIKGLRNDNNEIIITFDTHYNDYSNTLEGQKLPVEHCIWGTDGWNLNCEIKNTMENCLWRANTIRKETFGAIKDLPLNVKKIAISKADSFNDVEVEICGLCTDICVVSNALILRAAFPNMKITCDAKACAGTSIEAHKAALMIMKSCQIEVCNED